EFRRVLFRSYGSSVNIYLSNDVNAESVGAISTSNLLSPSGSVSVHSLNTTGTTFSAVQTLSAGRFGGSVVLSGSLGDVTLTQNISTAAAGGYATAGGIGIVSGGYLNATGVNLQST